ncbi:ferritin-like domain-containing protein [bacterium]|nr:ferritin-like domain-containing protein [bacterium]
MDKATVLSKLNEIQRWEWTGVAQYMQYHFLVRGPWRAVFSDEFKEGADESLGHAKKIGDKIVALGGTPTLERAEVKQTIQLDEMLQNSLAFEEGAVKLYSEAIAMAEEWGNKALVILLEDILLEEQDGAEEWAKIIASTETGAGQKSASKVG